MPHLHSLAWFKAGSAKSLSAPQTVSRYDRSPYLGYLPRCHSERSEESPLLNTLHLRSDRSSHCVDSSSAFS